MIFFVPKPLIPPLVLFARYLTVFRGGIEARMPKMLLQKPQAIPGVVQLHSMDSKGIPELMGADVVYPARLGVYQLG